ncbi:NUDIX domain-containing protein [Kitasatospora sp. NPDC048296]|uniref:NUDIX hydrolase n=1 Tax=Kitasatospora sp. NPDC048296 TaxID=3364048 RepID=UPI00371E70FD
MISYKLLAEQALAEGVQKLAAGTVVRDQQGRVLMLRRKQDDVLPGLWDYPAGGLNDDEDPRDGAIRELAEETGIHCADIEYARALDFVNTRDRLTRQFVFTCTVPDDTAVSLTEHDAFGWFRPGELPPTSDGYCEVIGWLTHRLAAGWKPASQYLATIDRPMAWACFLVRDEQGRVLGMRNTVDTTRWDWPGGNVEVGASPFDTALREGREEIGLDLLAENPDVVGRQRLIAIIHQQADHVRPVPSIGWVFDGGTLTEEQQARIVLDPAEHSEWRFETEYHWRHFLTPQEYRQDLQVLRAARAGRVLYLQRPVPPEQDFEGIIAFVTNRHGHLLMHHRDQKDGIAWPNHWTPIGGWREGDETSEETAVREVMEEAGITVTDVRPLEGPRHERVGPLSRVLRAVYDGDPEAIRLGDEGQAVEWVPFDKATDRLVPPYLRHYLDLIGT